MQRVSSTSKNMTSIGQKNDPAVPSLINLSKKDDFKGIPNLNNFIKSHTVSELDSRKVGIYKLKKCIKILRTKRIQLILSYKLGKTKYKIYSCIKIIIIDKAPIPALEGLIEISKGLFNTKEFKLNELPTNIVISINQNITKFNKEYEEILSSKEEKVKVKIVKKKTKFFEGLDI